jgi:hypothetical protein
MKGQKRKSRAEIKGEMLAMAEARIEELLAWREEAERPTLSAIEGMVLRIREEISVRFTEAVIQQEEQERMVTGASCAECKEEMSYKDSHPLAVGSWVGELKIERGYYYCARCKRGFFPLG